jgi:hypothetical protein
MKIVPNDSDDVVDKKKKESGCLVPIVIFVILLIAFFKFMGNPYTEFNRRVHVEKAIDKIANIQKQYENGRELSNQIVLTEDIVEDDVGKESAPMIYTLVISVENQIINIRFSEGAFGEEPFNIIFKPVHNGEEIYWDCQGGNLPYKYRPPACK